MWALAAPPDAGPLLTQIEPPPDAGPLVHAQMRRVAPCEATQRPELRARGGPPAPLHGCVHAAGAKTPIDKSDAPRAGGDEGIVRPIKFSFQSDGRDCVALFPHFVNEPCTDFGRDCLL